MSSQKSKTKELFTICSDFFKSRKAECFVCFACLCVLFGMYFSWKAEQTGISRESARASLWVTLLFAALGVIFVFKWFADFRTAAKGGACKASAVGNIEKSDRTVALTIFFTCILVNVLLLFFQCALGYIIGAYGSLSDGLSRFNQLDSDQYRFIAEGWYTNSGDPTTDLRLVFFPGYPILIRIAYFFIRDYMMAALTVSHLCMAGAGSFMYLLVRLDYDKDTALRAVKFMYLVPAGLFFITPMSESVFLFVTLAALYFSRRGNMLPAVCFGFYAAFTRSLGVIVMVPMVYELIKKTLEERPVTRKDRVKRAGDFALTLVVPAGLASYFLINKLVTGDAFKFMEYQKEHWYQEIDYFFNTASYQMANFVNKMDNDSIQVGFALWGMGLCALFGTLIMFIISAKRMRASYIGYSIVYYVMAMGATWLLSAPRYAAAMFTLPVSFALITKNKKVDTAVTILLTAIYVIYTIMFVNRWQVW